MVFSPGTLKSVPSLRKGSKMERAAEIRQRTPTPNRSRGRISRRLLGMADVFRWAGERQFELRIKNYELLRKGGALVAGGLDLWRGLVWCESSNSPHRGVPRAGRDGRWARRDRGDVRRERTCCRKADLSSGRVGCGRGVRRHRSDDERSRRRRSR